MSQPDLSSHNAALFEMPQHVADYLEKGLWPAEERLINEFFAAPPATVLDLGCGTGRTTVGLAERGYRVVGVDLSASMIARARVEHPTLNFEVMDASQLTFADASFDAVLFSFNGIDLIHPVAARMACLRHIMRVLRPGGGFVMSTHNLLGHLLSGPPFGSGAWRYGIRFALDQLRNRACLDGYFRIREGESGEWLWTYTAVPSATIKQLHSVGFEDVSARTLTGASELGVLGWRTVHTYLGSRRPA